MDHNSGTDIDPLSDRRMEVAELVMTHTQETRKASERARPSRQSIHASCWGLHGGYQDQKGSLIQTYHSLLS